MVAPQQHFIGVWETAQFAAKTACKHGRHRILSCCTQSEMQGANYPWEVVRISETTHFFQSKAYLDCIQPFHRTKVIGWFSLGLRGMRQKGVKCQPGIYRPCGCSLMGMSLWQVPLVCQLPVPQVLMAQAHPSALPTVSPAHLHHCTFSKVHRMEVREGKITKAILA